METGREGRGMRGRKEETRFRTGASFSPTSSPETAFALDVCTTSTISRINIIFDFRRYSGSC